MVTDASPSAQLLLEQRDGVQRHGDELLPSDQRLWMQWRACIRAVIQAGDGQDAAMLLPRRATPKPLAVTISSQARRPGFAAVARGVIVRIVDPASAPRDIGPQLMDLWRLTAAEARLVHALVQNGFALRDAADRLGVTYATVRTQLASVFAKTETRGQPELMRLVTRLSG